MISARLKGHDDRHKNGSNDARRHAATIERTIEEAANVDVQQAFEPRRDYVERWGKRRSRSLGGGVELNL